MQRQPAPQQHVTLSSETAAADPAMPGRYLALIAEVAEQLLAAEDAAAMVDSLFALIRRELRLDAFFNYRLEDERLVLEAHAGLTDAQAGAGAVLALGQAVCGCAARDRRRVHVTAVQASDDPLVAFVKDVGLDAYVCTPLVHGQDLLGTLGFGRRWADRFDADELHFLQTVCHYVALAKHRLKAERTLREALAVREHLLAELNHRVRNALQMAVGLVRIEGADAADPAARRAVARIADRLEVLAAAHRPLYSDDPSSVGVRQLLESVFGPSRAPVPAPAEAMRRVAIEPAVALALVIHLLLEDAPPGESPVIAIRDGATPAEFRIEVEGGHRGPAALDGRLALALLRQLGARVDFSPQRFSLTMIGKAP